VNDVSERITVDGDGSDWDMDLDFFSDMYLAWNSNTVLSRLYLRYDCVTSTMYVLVLAEDAAELPIAAWDEADEHWVKIDGDKVIQAPKEGENFGEFAWVGLSADGRTALGWEGATQVEHGSVNSISAHTNVDNPDEPEGTDTSGVRDLSLELRCYDLGDLPDDYLTTYGANIGAHHRIGDLWLGPDIDEDYDGKPIDSADGDDKDNRSDEDGVTAVLPWHHGEGGGKLIVVVSGQGTGLFYGWLDWDNDGSFDQDKGDYIVEGAELDVGSHEIYFTVPEGAQLNKGQVYARFRLFDASPASSGASTLVVPAYLPFDGADNGEVEDYRFDFDPTAVELSSFTATGTAAGVLVEWETASELDNLGFHLYHGETANGPWTRLNADLIPVQAPGSGWGGSYSWLDAGGQSTTHYVLEDVSVDGKVTRHGPIAVSEDPTAVSLLSFATTEATAPILTLLLALVMPLIGAAALLNASIHRRRR
jgi:hypothetical protein